MDAHISARPALLTVAGTPAEIDRPIARVAGTSGETARGATVGQPERAF